MTFHARLTELLEKATKGPWVVKNGNITTIPRYSRWGAGMNESGMVHKLIAVQPDNAELIAYIVNHAEAIRDLVVAAEKVSRAQVSTFRYEDGSVQTFPRLERDFKEFTEALAKLEES